ncbi:SAM-dependent methyltransferase [Beauveria bassiana ARSEF 2860]|uniref:SAM-dependent methyltransferase n=1 Tax=Beauveria bassiana (strain ARSEF 2860) TaxID=655819 RepID=J4KNR6_BEAB2|nr:SAM-dependent methyltransferase [Beauveria bassiana ARSEF 2860]EJP66169.1 SAM-dependent methyltransferase [Beauveria bassiana ARSEF 2860]
MFSSKAKPSSSQYEPLSVRDEGEGFGAASEKRLSSEDDHSVPLLEASDNMPAQPSPLPKLILYFSLALALLSTVNIALLPITLSKYQAHPFSDSELEELPYGDARLGLDRLADFLPPPQVYHHAWPDRIARVSRKLKKSVWGQGVQVYITVEDSTIMRFPAPAPSTGVNACAVSWRPPPELSARARDLITKGDVTEIEVWQLIAPSATASSSMDEVDYDTLSYSTLPVRGELLGVLDLTRTPNISYTVRLDFSMSTQPDAGTLARLSLHDPAHFGIQHSQTIHRLALLQHWNIAADAKVLELGCGQGDCTTVLADAVGERGKVVAVDPADLDYGAPYTLGQAQGHISQGPLGSRITWVQQPPLDYLSSLQPSSSTSPPGDESKSFDATVLAHSLWYFSSPSLILSTFSAIKQHSKSLLLAEWSLEAAHPSAQPHVLAALTQASLECRKPKDSDSNVRTVLGPKRLTELAVAAGWKLESETRVQAPEDMLDGQWEVSACLDSSFEEEVEEQVKDGRERAVVLALRDACEASLRGIEGGQKGVKTMDVWVAKFV